MRTENTGRLRGDPNTPAFLSHPTHQKGSTVKRHAGILSLFIRGSDLQDQVLQPTLAAKLLR